MSDLLTVVGFDPSMSNWGMVKGSLDINSGSLSITNMHLQVTEPDAKNKTVRKNSQDLHRARLLVKSVIDFQSYADLVFVEIPVGSQSARAMASYGMCIGILAAVNSPLIQVTPTEVKLAATGLKTATKQQMIDWATSTYPDAAWLTKKTKGITSFTNANEHLADALATIHAGVNTEQFKQARAIQLNLRK
jgi:Holliday junction resolvasome RuvABC endonuclease subunit